MAHRDDTDRVLAACAECESVYTARQWPDGSIRLIGQETCSCGSSEFEVVTEGDVVPDSDDSNPSSGMGDE
ncbi:hypothetical protein [Halopiger goleimassiliensis]|uniref:hypothetical protein n=1 Tax=Halopiger goleimassiliensis TaxID=1293048 RepID=UPI0006780F4B|nr:hypothetical protein [Halopiger goleimassiliensis]